MRASEFSLSEGKASRRKQASMNAQRRMANTAPAQTAVQTAPVSTPASATANYAQKPVTPSSNSDYSAGQRQVTPTMKAPQPKGADWAALAQATKPTPVTPQANSSYLDRIKQKMSTVGKSVANKLSPQNRANANISARTDKIFINKFISDLKTAEQTSAGLRGQPLDIKNWVNQYLTQNRWDAGDQKAALDKAVSSNNKPEIAKTMAAIGKYNNLGSTVSAKADAAKTNATGINAINQMSTQLTAPKATTTAPTQPMKIGDHTFDPNDPADAKILAMIKQQGRA